MALPCNHSTALGTMLSNCSRQPFAGKGLCGSLRGQWQLVT